MELLDIGKGIATVLGVLGALGFPSAYGLYRQARRREVEFSPARAFAYTYVDHFVEPLHDRLRWGRPVVVDGRRIERLYVRMPERLADVVHGGRPLPAAGEGGPAEKEVTVKTEKGGRTLRVRCVGEERLAFDVPRVLETLGPILTDYTGKTRSKGAAEFERLERREIQSFCRIVRQLVRDRGLRDHVRVFDCDVPALTAETDDLDAGPAGSWLDRVRDRLRHAFRTAPP